MVKDSKRAHNLYVSLYKKSEEISAEERGDVAVSNLMKCLPKAYENEVSPEAYGFLKLFVEKRCRLYSMKKDGTWDSGVIQEEIEGYSVMGLKLDGS